MKKNTLGFSHRVWVLFWHSLAFIVAASDCVFSRRFIATACFKVLITLETHVFNLNSSQNTQSNGKYQQNRDTRAYRKRQSA